MQLPSFRFRKIFSAAFVLFCFLIIGSAIILHNQQPPATMGFEEHSPKSDQPDKAQAYYLKKRLPPGETILPVERYLQASKDVKKMRQYSTATETFNPSENALKSAGEKDNFALPQWTFLGPGNIGGRTRAIVINPIDPNIIYAAGVAGGVWKSTDGGVSWAPLSDLIPNLAVVSLAIDSNNPNIIYAGTGESITGAGIRRAGIFKTSDGGITWIHLAGTASNDFYYVNSLVISPNVAQRLYAGTDTGIWRSNDGGASWVQLLKEVGCRETVIRKDRATDVLIASCGTNTKFGTNTKIYRNTDAGRQRFWEVVLAEENMGLTSLAIAPSNQNIIYAMASASAAASNANLHGFFRSVDGGATWTARVRDTDPPSINNSLLSYGCRPNFGQGWYDNVIAVDPTDADKVWAGGISVFRSDDGGTNWGLASSAVVHADIHALVFHPQYNGTTNNILFVGNDGGISKTENARDKVTNLCDTPDISWTNLNNNYGITQFYHGVPYPDGTKYFGGTQDNGTIRGDDATGANAWSQVLGADGGYVAIDPNNTDVIYAETQGLNIQKITNGGSHSTSAINGIIDSGFLFIVPFIMDPNNSQILWTGGDRMWQTTNGAENWTQASNVFTSSVSAIAVAPQNSNKVLAGTTGGTIHRTVSSLTSETWESSKPRDGYVSWIAFDSANTNVAYATYSSFNVSANDRHIYKSTDGGVSWVGIDGSGTTGIPDHPVLSLVVDPSNSSRLYVGTDIGVFVTLDGGATWFRENTGFANVPTEALAITNSGGNKQLFAFTHGRGAWRVPISCFYEIMPDNQSFTFSGNGSFNINTPNDCSWSAKSTTSWIVITSESSGIGNGTISFSVETNTTSSQRQGTITVSGQTFTINQAPGKLRRKKLFP